eukprot:scaffold1854_cov113-Isochrysis_galbana.AAC.10
MRGAAGVEAPGAWRGIDVVSRCELKSSSTAKVVPPAAQKTGPPPRMIGPMAATSRAANAGDGGCYFGTRHDGVHGDGVHVFTDVYVTILVGAAGQ